jgi:hypothetical protein
MERPMHKTVEALLSELEACEVSSKRSLEFWVPQQLTFRGQPVQHDVAMAIILDNILSKGYEPDGFAEVNGGRIYKYKPCS